MKKLFAFFVTGLFTVVLLAQAPRKMSYQSIVRNSSNDLVTNTNIGMQVSILQTSPSGTALFVERHFPTTNSNGLVSVEIGTGVLISGNFATIDWTDGPYFIKTEIDLNGGASYTITGTSQLLSVPYAFFAESTGPIDYNTLLSLPVLGITEILLENDTLKITQSSGLKSVNLSSLKNDTMPFPNSNIMTKSDQIMLNNMIGNPNQRWKLCYRKSEDGSSCTTYHTNCNLKGPSVSVILLSNGFVLGGYSKTSTLSSGITYIVDKDAFIFSITNRSKFPLSGRDDDHAVFSSPTYGPTYGGGHDIFVGPDITDFYCNFPQTYAFNGTSGLPTAEATQFLSGLNPAAHGTIIELEVWIQDY